MRRFLLLSLALHFAFTATLLGFRRGTPPSAVPAIVIDLPAPAEPAPITPAPQIAGIPSHAHLSEFAEKRPFSSLAPRHQALRALRPGENRTETKDAFSPYAPSGDPFGGALKNSGALTWVYHKAELTIGYPAPFIHHDITGNATARLVFDSSGKLKPELLHVEGDSPYLRVYVYRTLESAFQGESVPNNLVRWKDTLEVYCFVKFSLSEATEVKIATTPILGNKLFFARNTVKSKAEKLKWNLGPLNGVGPIPLVGVDMLWFARKVEERQHPLRAQAEADDLAPWRRDPLFHQI